MSANLIIGCGGCTLEQVLSPCNPRECSMPLLSDTQLIDRIFAHVDGRTSDKGDSVWREPAANYSSEARFQAELQVMRRLPVVFCPSGAVAGPGDYVARVAAGVPLLVVRGEDGVKSAPSATPAGTGACRWRRARAARKPSSAPTTTGPTAPTAR